MRKFLFFAASVAVLAGCTKQYVDEPQTDGSAAKIGFETYVANSTKGLAKKDFVMGDQFFVYGGTTASNDFDLTNVNFGKWVFDAPTFAKLGAIVSNYGGNPAVWRYNDPVMWSGEKVTFFAFSPAPTDVETYGITQTNPANLQTIPSIGFEVKGGYDPATADAKAIADSRLLTKDQVDLLWVTTPNQTSASGTIAMMFKHALTRLNVSVRSQAPAGTMIRINTITLKDVIVDGTLALAHDESKKGDIDYIGGWAIGTTKKDFAVNLINSEASLITDKLIHDITDDDEALMMIPQSLTDVKMEVKYASSADGTNWDNYETGLPVTVKLVQDKYTHWNPNKQIRYVLNITPGEVITFSAEVEAWGDEESIELITKTVSSETQEVIKLALKTGDKISTVKKEGWITYAEGAATATDLKDEFVIPADGTYTFGVKNNVLTTDRIDEIIIIHKDPTTTTSKKSQTVVKVTQSKNNGILNAPAGGGLVATFTLADGDKITALKTKEFSANWVLVNGNPLSSEYTTKGEVKITVAVNTGAARKAGLTLFLNNTAVEYTIEQAAVETKLLSSEEAGGQVHAGAKDEVITLVLGGGDWLKITDNGGAATTLVGEVTAAGAYTLDADANTGEERTASFTVTSGDKVILYNLTQKGSTAPVELTAPANGKEVHSGAVGEVITLKTGGGKWFTITNGGSTATELIGVMTSTDAYTLDAGINLTTTARTAGFSVKVGTETKSYNLTQAAATEEAKSIAAAGGEVFTGVTIGADGYIEVLSGDATFTDGAGAPFVGKVTTAGTYTVNADMNTTTTAKTAKIAVVNADGVKIYNVTVAAATTETIEFLEAGETKTIELVAGDVIKGNGTASTWLSLASPAASEQSNLSADVAVTDAGTWNVVAGDNTGSAARTENFTVVKADGTVVIYTASQAGI